MLDVSYEMRKELKELLDSSGSSIAKILRAHPDKPRGISVALVSSVVRGDVHQVKPEQHEYIRKVFSEPPKPEDMPVYIDLDDDMIKALKKERERTGVTYKFLGDRAGEKNYQTVTNVFKGKQHTIRESLYKSMIATMAVLPDTLPEASRKVKKRKVVAPIKEGFIKITPKMRERLQAHRERTGVGGDMIVKYIKERISGSIVCSWLADGGVRQADKESWELVEKAYESFPTAFR